MSVNQVARLLSKKIDARSLPSEDATYENVIVQLSNYPFKGDKMALNPTILASMAPFKELGLLIMLGARPNQQIDLIDAVAIPTILFGATLLKTGAQMALGINQVGTALDRVLAREGRS